MWALVPIKSLESAKQRLASVLSSDERHALVLAMARDLLSTLKRCSQLSGILIVSRSPEAHALAEAFNTERFAESPGCNLSESLTQAGQHLEANYEAHGVVVIPADLPLLDLGELEELLRLHDTLTLAPDQAGIGTNALAATPWNLIAFNFNEKSFIPHTDAGFKAGVTPMILKRPGFSLDVDTPQDLITLLQEDSKCQTATFLIQSGIAERLQSQPSNWRVTPDG